MILDALKRQVGNILLLSIGAYFFFGSWQWLDLGTARRMGPGFLPMGVGAILCVLAIVALFTTRSEQDELEKPDPLSVITVLSGVAAFAIGVPYLGVLPAAFLAVLFTSFADFELTFLTRVLLGLGVSLGIWLVFIVGLNLPFTPIQGL